MNEYRVLYTTTTGSVREMTTTYDRAHAWRVRDDLSIGGATVTVEERRVSPWKAAER